MKRILSLVVLGMLSMSMIFSIAAMDTVKKFGSAVKRNALCLVQPQKNNCTQAEIATARNWAAGLSISALVLAVAGAAAGGGALQTKKSSLTFDPAVATVFGGGTYKFVPATKGSIQNADNSVMGDAEMVSDTIPLTHREDGPKVGDIVMAWDLFRKKNVRVEIKFLQETELVFKAG